VNRVIRFVPRRLLEAREARGISGGTLAQLAGLSPAAISKYENGRLIPGADTLQQIADILKFPVAFFTLSYPLQPGDENPVFWRRLSSSTKGSRVRCLHRLTWLQSITAYVREFLDLPDMALPRLDLRGVHPLELTNAHIERLATEARAAFGLGNGPIPDMVLLLENHGVIVSRFQFEADDLDAFSHWGRDGQPYIALGADKRSLARQHANAAHELAHLLLHNTLAVTEFQQTANHRILELQARRFASAFCLPDQSFTSELWAPTFTTFESLKPRWRVSIGMMIGRCAELGILSEEQERNMWIQYARRGYKKREPLDDQMPEVTPRLLRRSIEMIVDEGTRTRDDVKADLALPEEIIEELCSLKTGYLSDRVDEAVVAMPKRKEPVTGDSDEARQTKPTIIPFAKQG